MADERRTIPAPNGTDPLTYERQQFTGRAFSVPTEPPPDIRKMPPLYVERLAELNAEQQAKVMGVVNKLFPDEKAASRRILKHLMTQPLETSALMKKLAKEEYEPGKKYKASKQFVLRALWILRDRLEEFALTPEGMSHPLRMEVPRGTNGKLHTFQISKNIPAKDVHAFWLLHFENGKQTKVVIAGPGFVFTRRRVFVSWGNGLEYSHWAPSITEKIVPGFKKEHMKEFGRYVSVQDVQAVSPLFGYLSERCRACGVPAPRFSGAEEGLRNPAFNYLVVDCDPRQRLKGKSGTSQDEEHEVVIAREWEGAYCSTYVLGSHSSAVEAVCRFITNPDQTEALTKLLLAEHQWLGFPVEFEMTFRVRLGDVQTKEDVRVERYHEMAGWARNCDGSYHRAPGSLTWRPRWS
jgi:hypothetical protein